jgi:hypothetical protein
MTSGKTIIYIVMSAVAASLIPATALAVPVVPNFTQGSMTSHTETTSKVTETINSIDYATGWQYSVSGTNVTNGGTIPQSEPNDKLSDSESIRRNRGASNKRQLWSRFKWTEFHNRRSRSSIPVHSDLHGTGCNESNCDSKNHRGYKHYRHNKYLYPIKVLCLSALTAVVTVPAHAADVGGVSATANPIANSSGSVTNQAIRFYKDHISLTNMVVV